MSFHSMRRLLAALLISVLVSACGGGGPASPPAGGITVAPGDGQVIISWTADPGVDYWLFFVAGTSISTSSLSSAPGHQGRTNVTSPYVLTGLTNGVTYAFTMDGRVSGGPGGPGTPSVTALPRPAGTTWTAGTTLGSTAMRGTAFGTASDAVLYYVSVGDGGAVYRSPSTDGATWTPWTPVTSGLTSNLNAALYGLGKFITVGASGNIFYSTDTLTWTAATSNTTQNLNAMATNGALVIAVGDGGAIQYSTDGITWSSVSGVPTANLYGIAYTGTGLWVAVGAGGTLLTSTTGLTWSAATSGTSVDLKSVTYRPATIITNPTTPLTTTTYPATFVAVGLGGTVLTSTDAATWTSQTVSPASDLLAISATASQFLAVGAGGAAFTSPDGTTWTSQTTNTTANLFGLINAQAQYIAVGQNGTNLYSR
jgi:hypothetical protein